MPKIYMSESKSSGLDVTYYRKDRRISFGGWYDHFVGIEPTEMSLREFLNKLGITLRDCEKALIEDCKEDSDEIRNYSK